MDARRLTLWQRHQNAQPADLRDAKDLATARNVRGASGVRPAGSLTRTRSGDKRAHIYVPRRYDSGERRSDLLISLEGDESIQCGFTGANEFSGRHDILLSGYHIRVGRPGCRQLGIA